jgi:hypothetical protein
MLCFMHTTVPILPSDLNELTILVNGVNCEVLRYIMFPILLLSLANYIHNLPCAFFFEVPSEFVLLTNKSKFHTL